MEAFVDKTALERILNGPTTASDSSEVKAILVADTRCTLGDCVLFDDERHMICWTDIDGRCLYQLNLDVGTVIKRELPTMLGAFALTNQDGVYLCGWEDGFQLWNVNASEAVSEYSKGPPVNRKGLPSRLNDGRCDPTGERFICGGYFGDMEHVRMHVFSCRMESPGKLVHEPILHNVRIANSLCFSPTGGTMYFCDSPTKVIRQYEYTNGTPYYERDVWSWTGDVGFPDGSCVDHEGFIWSALWHKGAGPGRIHRINPGTGQLVYTVHMPDTTSQCTCVCFGGKDLNVLFITTASIDRDLSTEPHAGGLYAVKVPFRGRPESRFQLQ